MKKFRINQQELIDYTSEKLESLSLVLNNKRWRTTLNQNNPVRIAATIKNPARQWLRTLLIPALGRQRQVEL